MSRINGYTVWVGKGERFLTKSSSFSRFIEILENIMINKDHISRINTGIVNGEDLTIEYGDNNAYTYIEIMTLTEQYTFIFNDMDEGIKAYSDVLRRV